MKIKKKNAVGLSFFFLFFDCWVFAEKHKTIGQSIGLDNKNSKLKKFDKENKTLKDLFKNYIK